VGSVRGVDGGQWSLAQTGRCSSGVQQRLLALEGEHLLVAPLVQVDKVSKAFRVDGRIIHALDGVSLSVAAGQFVSLIGPSGCGKSTLLNLICGLMEPDQGLILLHGQDQGRRLGHVGYMPQRDLLLPWRKVLGNILLGPEMMGLDLDQAKEQARDLLPLFGLDGFADSYPAELSGGMRQRAALMRTMLCQQEIILLDEPLGALDALTRRTMRSWLLEVWRRFQQTMLFVTHDVEEAIYLSDRVYLLSPRPGRVIYSLDIDLPRPRNAGVIDDPRFVVYRHDLLQVLGV